MNSAPLWGMAALLIAALAIAACAPKAATESASAETAAQKPVSESQIQQIAGKDFEQEETETEPEFDLDLVLHRIKHESHFIKGLDYHGGAWWSYDKAPESDSWPLMRHWDLFAYADSDRPDFSKAGGDFEIAPIALNDMVNFDPASVKYDEETSTFSARDWHGLHSVEFTMIRDGLKRTIANVDGMVEYATYDRSILDLPVSRNVQINSISDIEYTDELLIRIEQPIDRSDRIGEMSMWEPKKWIPIPAIGVLPFDKIESVHILPRSALGHTIEIRGMGLGRKLRSRVTILALGHNVEVAQMSSGKVLISAREVYEVDRDKSKDW